MNLFRRRQKPDLNEQHRVALQYLVARLNNCITIGDPAYDYLPTVAEHLVISLDLDAAEKELRLLLPAQTCWSIERLLTGEPWRRDGDHYVSPH